MQMRRIGRRWTSADLPHDQSGLSCSLLAQATCYAAAQERKCLDPRPGSASLRREPQHRIVLGPPDLPVGAYNARQRDRVRVYRGAGLRPVRRWRRSSRPGPTASSVHATQPLTRRARAGARCVDPVPLTAPRAAAQPAHQPSGGAYGWCVCGRVGVACGRRPSGPVGVPASAVQGSSGCGPGLPSLPASRLSVHGMAAASGASEPGVGSVSGKSVVEGGERLSAARHLRGLGHRVRSAGQSAHRKCWGDPRLHSNAHGSVVVPSAQHDDRLGVPGQ